MLRLLLLLVCTATAAAQVTTTPVEGLRTKTVRLVALTKCTVVPEPGKRIDNATIIIRNDRIEAVGSGLAIPAGADVRDCSGLWVYAGFVDPYLDLADVGAGKKHDKHDRGFSDEDEGPNTPPPTGARHWNQAIKPEYRASTSLTVDADAISTLLRVGITAGAVSDQDGIFRGSAATVILRPGVAATTILADNVYQGLSFRKGTSKTPYPSSQMGSIALLRQAFLDADWYGKAHAYAASHPASIPPEVNVSLEALRSAMDKKQTFVAHTQDELDIVRWDRIAKEASVSMVYVGTGREFHRLATLAPLKPTIILPVVLPEAPDMRDPISAHDVGLGDLMHWYWAADNARLVDSIGCTIAFTTSGLKDRTQFLTRIRSFVERGLDTTKALAALTTVPARLSGVADRCGKIAPGYMADLVIATENIFAEKSTIRSVVVAGETSDLSRPAEVDVRGTWSLTSTALPRQLKITITGTAEDPSAAAAADSTNIPMTLSVRGARMQFTLRTDTLGMIGFMRGAAVADSIMINGTLDAPNGTLGTFVMRRDSAASQNVKKKNVAKLTPRIPFPSTRLPFGPFGFDTEPAQRSVLLKNATVWTCGPSGTQQQSDVLIQNGRIAGIGKGLSGGDTTIDCIGMHITPGVIDEHSHIAITRGVNEGTHAVTTEVRIGDVLDPDDVNIYRQLSGGVTSSHLLHGSANPMGGQLQLIKLRWGQDAEGLKFQGAMPTVKFALGENVKQSNWGDRFSVRYPQTRMGVEELMRDAFRAAREYEADMKKVNDPTVMPVRRDIQLDALVEILNSKRYIHCHSYVQSEILMLMRLAEEFGFRVKTFTHILEGYKVAKEMAAHGAGASSFSDWWAYKFEVYDAIPENPAILHENGVLVSVNSDDAEMARRLNQEAAKSVKYGGVVEDTAIRFCTINPATQLAVNDKVGSLEVGKDADVVVWTGHPLSNMSRVERTFVDGRLMFDRSIDAQLRTRDAQLRVLLEQEAMRAAEGGAAMSKGGKPAKHEYDCNDMDDEMSDVQDRN